jgi:hypothetical protein
MTDINKLTADESDRLSREAANDGMFGEIDPHEAEMDAAEAANEASGDAITLASLAAEPVWVAWQTQDRGGKPTKVPFNPNGRAEAKANDHTTWGTREEAEKRAAGLRKPYGLGGVGIEFTAADDGWSTGGIDLDSCRDKESGQLELWAANLIERFKSYTEVSPSGTGAKIFFRYQTADLDELRTAMGGAQYGRMFKRPGSDHPPAIEVHLGNRYFAVTDDLLPGSGSEIRNVETELLLDLLYDIGPNFVAEGKAAEAEEAAAKKASTEAEKAERKAEAEKERAAKRARKESNDRSRSAVAFSKGKQLRRGGATYEEMVVALAEDPETAAWTQAKGKVAGERELRRIWAKAAANGPVINVESGELHIATTAAEAALIASKLPIFQRGKSLVQPLVMDVPGSHGRITQSACLGELNVFSMVDHMCGVAEFQKYDARTEDYVRVNPPGQVAQILLNRQGRWNFPVIAGVITTPTLRPDGTLLTAPGYDEAMRLYHIADPTIQLHPAVHRPTRAAAEQALKALRELLAEFPFVDQESTSVGLSALITPIVRGAMPVAPLHELTAPTPGSGKSYLADVASAIYSGRPCPVVRASEDPKETEKALAGLLLSGHPLISLDNVNGEMGSDLLCQAVERPLIQIGTFGVLDVIEVASVATILANGNNLRVRADLVRRTIKATLDAQMERPELREFKSDPVATVLASRGRYVSACLIIVRAYLEAGMPSKPAPLASFNDWSDLVRGALLWLGGADPVVTMEAARQDDPELTELREMMAAWEANLRNGDYTLKDVAQRLELRQEGDYGPTNEYLYPDLREIVFRKFSGPGGVNTRRFGNWLADQEGRIVGGRRFKRSASHAPGGVAKWFVEILKR